MDGIGERWVAAPADERSGVGHGFTPFAPLIVQGYDWGEGKKVFSITGNPADAVQIAMRSLLPRNPDLVISGINRGENTGVDLLYSGTVAGAREAAIYGIPAISVSRSTRDYPEFETAASIIRNITLNLLDVEIPSGVVINVNVPGLPLEQIKGIRIAHQAESHYIQDLQVSWDGNGRGVCNWEDITKKISDPSKMNDYHTVRKGYVAVTPIHHRMTESPMMARLKYLENLRE